MHKTRGSRTQHTFSTMRARDVGVSVVAAAAALLALQGTPDVDIQLRW